MGPLRREHISPCYSRCRWHTHIPDTHFPPKCTILCWIWIIIYIDFKFIWHHLTSSIVRLNIACGAWLVSLSDWKRQFVACKAWPVRVLDWNRQWVPGNLLPVEGRAWLVQVLDWNRQCNACGAWSQPDSKGWKMWQSPPHKHTSSCLQCTELQFTVLCTQI